MTRRDFHLCSLNQQEKVDPASSNHRRSAATSIPKAFARHHLLRCKSCIRSIVLLEGFKQLEGGRGSRQTQGAYQARVILCRFRDAYLRCYMATESISHSILNIDKRETVPASTAIVGHRF
ncbi:hypothetical protein Emed_002790 [Eimeria media]